jgi:uncharacterized protein YhdP
MIVKKTHHTLQIIFALFVAYLLVTRLLITWVQTAPEQVVSAAEWLTDSEVSFKSIDIQQGVLGFQLQAEELSVHHADYELQMQTLDVDVNVFSPFFPSIDYGAYLKIEEGVLQFKNVQPVTADKQADVSQLNLQELRRFDVDISRLWQRVKVKDFILSEVVSPGLSIHVHEFQSLKGAQLSLSSEFSLGYKDSLNFEKFSFKSTLVSNVWGGVEYGEFSLSSFQPLQAERIVQLLPNIWHSILPKGELILDLKAKVAQSKIAKLVVNLNGQSLKWPQQHTTLPKSMGLELAWSSEHQNIKTQFTDWHFTLSKIQLDNKYIQTVSPIELSFEDNQMLHFSSNYFDIEPFKVIVKSLVPNKHIATLFDKAAHLKISGVSGDLNWETLELPLLQVKFDKLSIPVTDYPGLAIQNLTVHKQANRLSLQTDKPIWVTQTDIHQKPMRIDLPAKVVIDYKTDSGYWNLPRLKARVDDFPVQFSIRANDKGDVDSQLNVKIDQLSVLKEYLPYSFMPKSLQKWLQESLVAGEAINLDVALKGNIEAFPFENGGGVFTAIASIEKAKLKFHSDWPMLTDFAARIKFTPFQLEITADEVNVGSNLTARDVVVTIPNLDQDDIALNIQGKVSAKLDHAVDYLIVSPLAKLLGLKSFLKRNAILKGRSIVSIDRLWVPLSGYPAKSEEVKGTVELRKAVLSLQDKVTLSDIQGVLNFTEIGVEANKLTAKLLDGPATIKVTTNKKSKMVTIDAKGESFSESSLFFEKPLPWSAGIQIPFKNSRVRGVDAKIVVNIADAQSLLPAPLAKQVLVGKKVTVHASSQGDLLSISANLPGLVNLQGEWHTSNNEYKVAQLKVVLGENGKAVDSTVSNGASISGQLQMLDLDGWIALYKAMPELNLLKSSKSQIDWNASQLKLQNMLLWGKEYPDINIQWESVLPESVLLKVKSPSVDAEWLTNSTGVADVYVKHLEVVTTEVSELAGRQSCGEQAPEQGLFPEMIFKGKNIILDGRKIDTLDFELKDSSSQLVLSGLKGSFGNRSGNITGNYLFDKSTLTSKLALQLNSDNVAAVTNFLQLKKGFTGKAAKVDVALDWKGGVSCFSRVGATGEVVFNLKEGSIEDIEPGFARLIGLLSIESLARRLKLDVKDVTNKGMVYDTISGKAVLSNGSLELQSFDLKAPSASAKLFGKVDLINQQFNLKANVTPAIGASIPAVAALVGAANPLAALAVYSLMKIIPGINENLITYKYDITGPWLNPKVMKVDTKFEVKDSSVPK